SHRFPSRAELRFGALDRIVRARRGRARRRLRHGDSRGAAREGERDADEGRSGFHLPITRFSSHSCSHSAFFGVLVGAVLGADAFWRWPGVRGTLFAAPPPAPDRRVPDGAATREAPAAGCCWRREGDGVREGGRLRAGGASSVASGGAPGSGWTRDSGGAGPAVGGSGAGATKGGAGATLAAGASDCGSAS